MDGVRRKRKKRGFSINCLLSKKEIKRLIDRHTVQKNYKRLNDSHRPRILSHSCNSTLTKTKPTPPLSLTLPRPLPIPLAPLSLASFHPPPQSRSVISSRSSSGSSSPSIPSHLAPKPLLIPALSSLPTSSLSTNHAFQPIDNGHSDSRSRFRRSPTPGPWGKMLSKNKNQKVKDDVDKEKEIDTWVITDVVESDPVTSPRIKLKRVSKTDSSSPSLSPPKIFIASPEKSKGEEIHIIEDEDGRLVTDEDFDGSLVCFTSQSGSSTPPLLVPFSPSPPPSPSSSSLSDGSSPLPSFSRFLYSPAIDSPCPSLPSLPSPCPLSIHDKDKPIVLDTYLNSQKNDKIKLPHPPPPILKYDTTTLNGTAASDCSSTSPPITRRATSRINSIHHTETAKDERASRSVTPTPVFSLESVNTIAPPNSYYYNILLLWQGSLNSARGSEAPIFIENLYDNEPPPVNFKYITSSIYSTNVPVPNITALVGCSCLNCSESVDCCPQLAGQKAAYTKDKRMKAARGTPIYECNFMCSCSSTCYNRVVQFGRQFPVCIFRTRNGRGWGVKTCSDLKRGTFVTEYVGEVITTEEAERRGVTYDREGSTYLFDLDFDEDHPEFTIDAGHCGNISHFFNHSCSPNLQVFSVWINTLDTRLPQLALFAKKDIVAGEELTFDYQMSHNLAGHTRGKGRVPCLCGSSKCRGFLI
ncbi:PREDICTED: flocculation protein FLO11-like isoform X2 [Amphimedon queenslandica]|uniref:Histone-lysine N-methyltransferase n=1 Tax=Amphimedon queenslandica TaxID=400682 RepID=A0A1X7TYL4_AMPQE|nr:PREDICTED: flocculation protein FLO11-like isoform X2 [Amphimedon queenslandica]|eukprot:XP_019857051.1 PREDICTED: flocculation protein FLO11-like isoform X2 [Amphimedon queenslandica]